MVGVRATGAGTDRFQLGGGSGVPQVDDQPADHGATGYSADADFARFPGVRWVDPLAG